MSAAALKAAVSVSPNTSKVRVWLSETRVRPKPPVRMTRTKRGGLVEPPGISVAIL